MLRLELQVRGVPQPQGSARAFVAGGRARVVTGASSGPLADWRHAIATEARAAMAGRPVLDGPVVVRARFAWPRPKSHRGARGLLSSAPTCKTTKPDLDKCSRALLDALTGVVYRDDGQVVRLDASKAWDDAEPGVAIVVEEVAP